MTPIIGGDDLYVFTESTSPKLRDPNADKPYARHSPVWTNTGEGGEFLVGGEALETDSADERQLLVEERYVLFRVDVGRSRVHPVRGRWPSTRTLAFDEQIAVRDSGHPCEEPIHETIEVVSADPSQHDYQV